jgi:hypothetical protein
MIPPFYRNADIPFIPLWQIAISVTLLFVALCRLVCCKSTELGYLYGKKPTGVRCIAG